ncbi:hypothetical protein ABZ208_19325 [Streptomyces sp. NPDC006208]|uniref:hypothetical protein n=1 Tax=Streptomyces sp. NPDC006208 TaxID=3156734 RepID=UPI0033A7859E
MSVSDERKALAPRTSLYDHALRLHRQAPDEPLPDGGRPLPDQSAQPGRSGSVTERSAGLQDALTCLGGGDIERTAQELHTRVLGLDLSAREVSRSLEAVPLPDGEWCRSLGRHLVRHAVDRRTVWVGLALLGRHGLPRDAELIRTVGLLACCTGPAADALVAVDCATGDLSWLAERSHPRRRRKLIEALCTRGDPASRRWLLAEPLDRRTTPASQARSIAESTRLAEVLDQQPLDAATLAQAARLLAVMTDPNDYRSAIGQYTDAMPAYAALVRRLGELPPSLDHYALLLSLLLDLHSGRSALLDWEPGERERIAVALRSVLSHPEWTGQVTAAEPSADIAERRRAAWILHATGATYSFAPAERRAFNRLAVQVTVPDPAGPGQVETRLLVDGTPVIAQAFDSGQAQTPEYLLGRGLLRASEEPTDVQLAEAWCTEGCCGALYVTISREGDTVVWRNWRRPNASRSAAELPLPGELRFDAAEYDEEISRAESDHTWEWPARTVARLLGERLRAEPGLLGRWRCAPGWIGTHYAEPEQVELSFTYPSPPAQDTGNAWVQFVWTLPDGGTPPEERAEAALRRLAEVNPTTYATLAGGSREAAQALGFTWPERSRA